MRWYHVVLVLIVVFFGVPLLSGVFSGILPPVSNVTDPDGWYVYISDTVRYWTDGINEIWEYWSVRFQAWLATN